MLRTAAPVLLLVFLVSLVAGSPALAQPPLDLPDDYVARVHELPPLRTQAEEQQAWAAARVDRVVTEVMRRHGVDLWILSMREYGEDPVFWALTSPTTFAARRRSIYVFHDRGPEEGVARLALGGTSQGGIFELYQDPEPETEGGEFWGDAQWRTLRRLVERADPERIAVNIDPVHAFSDGLGAGEWEALQEALGPELMDRIVREPRLALEVIETRLPEMMPRYRKIQETVHALLATAFSSAVIEPGVTTTDDVSWWLRQEVQDLGMTVWFHPTIRRARQGEGWATGVIERGDALWSDFGVIALGLHTDTQHLGYVLRDGETTPPAGLRECLTTSNRLQDILLAEMTPGRTGNEVLRAARAEMESQGIDGTVYSHPIGDHGHGAGPLIGLWDRQGGVEHRGDLTLRPSTWFSIELQATSTIPEWGGDRLSCRQEEEAYLDSEGERHWTFRRQERFHLVR